MSIPVITNVPSGRIPIPSPEVTDLMIELARVKAGDKVLEIGTGSGFQTWKLAALGATVHSVELAIQIDPVNTPAGVYLHAGDGSKGLAEHAPFDVIFSTCGVPKIPKVWGEQLRDGGRLVVPIGTPEVQRLALIEKHAAGFNVVRIAAYVRFVMMQEATPTKPIKPVYREKPDAF